MTRQVMRFDGYRYIDGDKGQEIIRAAEEASRPIWVQFKRGWRERLFSWPWRPWQKFIGPPIRMRVAETEIRDFDGETSFSWTLVQDPA